MTAETKKCQNCKAPFDILEEDMQFYSRINVPPPTWCPECRLIRRFAWRNERNLYKRKCGLCHKDILSIYAPDTFMVYCTECWWGDEWDPMRYARDYDFSRSFFTQYKDFLYSVPMISLWGFNNVNCDFASYIGYSKNCYLSSSIVHCEDIFYSTNIDRSTGCFDCDFLADAQSCYENSNSGKNYSSLFLVNSRECVNCAFLFDCANCQHCFMSSNLRNKTFVFRNQQCTKEVYERKLKEAEMDSFKSSQKFREEFTDLKLAALHKFANILKSKDVTGDEIFESKSVQESFRIMRSENVKHCWRIANGFKDAYDVSGALDSELVYEGQVAADHNYEVKFYSQFKNSKYCDYCIGGSSNSNLFGCVGLRNKQYCILNKQYTKEEYEALVPKIIEHMNTQPYVDQKERTYRYGEFFPSELSPFPYNETLAQEYFSLTKEKALAQGYRWKDQEARNYGITKKPEDLPDRIKDADDSILKETVGCAHAGGCGHQCTTAFKIIPEELAFYRKMDLPLPRLCPNCRHQERLEQRNPLKLWHRRCMCKKGHQHGDKPCPNEFETSYSPERKEVVYCESCYNAEVV